MKKRKPADEKRKLWVEHITGQVQKMKAEKVDAEVH